MYEILQIFINVTGHVVVYKQRNYTQTPTGQNSFVALLLFISVPWNLPRSVYKFSFAESFWSHFMLPAKFITLGFPNVNYFQFDVN